MFWKKKKFYIPAGVFFLLACWYIITFVPFGKYDYSAAETTKVQSGQYQYNIPLDPQSPWPKFRGNELQNGRAPVKPKVKTGSRPWEFRTKKGIFSSPVVDGEGNVYVGSADHYFYKLNKAGNLVWKYATGEIIDSSALLDNKGRVYFGSGDGKVYGLDKKSGKKIWSFTSDTTAEVKEKFNIKTFNVNWFEGNISMLKDGTLLAPNDNYLVYAIDRNTGARKTQYFGNEMIWSVPAVNINTGRIFFGTCFMAMKNVYSYDPVSGTKLWSSGGLGTNAASILLTSHKENGALVVGGFDGYVRAYAQDTGKELWKYGSRDHIYSSPAQQANGTIIQPSADGTVYALSPETGEKIWAFDTLEPIRSSPAIDAEGIIYVGSGEGTLFAINPNGTLRWGYKFIQEDRNDINSSPALGEEGIYVGGENGGIFFMPYDYPLTPAGRKDKRSIVTDKEPLPESGTHLVYITKFGSLLTKPPLEIEANEPLAFALFVREKGDTILSAIDKETTKAEISNGHPALVNVSADRRFITLVPQEKWTGKGGGNLEISIQGKYLTNLSRFGLKFYSGKQTGTFSQKFNFKIRARNQTAVPFKIPSATQKHSSVIEISRQSVPNPTMLPSWNQIGFDSLHYLIGMVEQTPAGIVTWVVPGKLDEKDNTTRVNPELHDVYPLLLDYDGGLVTFTNYDGFKISFVGTWDMPFGFYRLASAVNASSNKLNNSASLNAVARGDEIEFYGKFLKLMGMTDFKTGLMHAYGGLNLSQWGVHSGEVQSQTGTLSLKLHDDKLSLTAQQSKIKVKDHVLSLLLISQNGKPVAANYSRGTKVEADQNGFMTKVELTLPEHFPKGVYAVYIMVDTYPAQKMELKVN